MFEVLKCIRLAMSDVTSWRHGLFLALLMVMIAPLSLVSNTLDEPSLAEEPLSKSISLGTPNYLTLNGNSSVNTDINFQVPEHEPVTDLDVSIKPDVFEQYSGFIWDTKSHWDNANALRGSGIKTNANNTISVRNNGDMYWTSPTIGWGNGASVQTAYSSYFPLYVDAFIPQGAYLNWSITDQTGTLIPGFSGSNDALIPVNLLDYQNTELFRLKFDFAKNFANNGPVVYSVSGDGSQKYDFSNDIYSMKPGWTVNCGTTENFAECGTVEDLSIDQAGSLYVSSNNVGLNSDNGTGLVVDYSATESYYGGVNRISSISPVGEFYEYPGSFYEYDFDNGLDGWELNPPGSSSGNNAHSQLACGRNGSSGKSLEISGPGRSNINSPIVDLSNYNGDRTISAWVREGTYTCGEPPDSGEDLKLQYKDVNNVWVDLHTFPNQISSSSSTPILFSQTLPTAALHPNSQLITYWKK